jgi:hypothetical protein
MASTRPLAELLQAIRAGKYDYSLDTVGAKLVKEIGKRMDVMGKELAETLDLGDRVRIVGELKPKYFTKKCGRVAAVDVEAGKVTVKLDTTVKRHGKLYSQVTVPAHAIEVLD